MPELLEGISPELKKRMQGKSCFHFKNCRRRALQGIGQTDKRWISKILECEGYRETPVQMSQSLVDRYCRWFEYEKDSNAKVLASLNAVDAVLRSSEDFQKAVDLMAHMVAARRVWLYRFGVSTQSAELFPRRTQLQKVPTLVNEMQREWSDYLLKLNDQELSRVFEYQSYDGARFRNTIEDILTQLHGHSLYHRGQIAMILRSIGAEPAVTDFVYWAREPV